MPGESGPWGLGGGTLGPGDVLVRKYRLVNKLGEGGMATVWVADNLALHTRVAVKVMHGPLTDDPRLVARFRREARATAALDHENVVRVYDFGLTVSGAPFIVMELLQGETLAARLRSRGKLTVEEAVRVGLASMRGVAAAHAKGVIHRDLKPENIFLALGEDGRERPKILDFGVSLIVDGSDRSRHGLTQAGALLGTPAYVSPEAIRGEAPVDARADIWALGVLLYEMLAGKLPFQAPAMHELIDAIVGGDPIPLEPPVDPALEALILRALAKDPDARFATVREFYEELANFARTSLNVDGSGTDLRRALTNLSSFDSFDSSDADDVETLLTPSKHSSRPPSTNRAPSTRPPAGSAAATVPPYSTRVGVKALSAKSPPRRSRMSWAGLLAVSVAGALGLGVIIGLLASANRPKDSGGAEFLLHVEGLPPNATVTVDGRSVALPYRAPRGGPVTVRVEAQGCKTWQQPNVAASGEVHLFYPSDRCP
ncbi:MAG TPA: serine/threonine-protein kinase [Polyangiaceae bacterium]|nr:serine/threonine-protein kinase [Polyangiaceae bacterium]